MLHTLKVRVGRIKHDGALHDNFLFLSYNQLSAATTTTHV
ncbi:hypothetical protein RSAG8_05797, partial [Rhizoctonia solani AG-8 WAC10335]